MSSPLHLLHVHPGFGPGGQEVRSVSIINALGREFTHSILAMDRNYAAAELIDPAVSFQIADPIQKGYAAVLSFLKRLRGQKIDLLLTYNWGAMDAVMAARLLGNVRVVHAEDGFGADEAVKLKRRRVWIRRFLLDRIHATVVPSRTLERIATESYQLPAERLRYIPNGIDCNKYQPGRNPELRASLGLSEGNLVLGFVGHLRPEKNLTLLLEAFAAAGIPRASLLFIGDGSCRREAEESAARLGLTDRVVFAGAIRDVAPYYKAMDVFVMSSVTEQSPMALLEAMASGLPAVCTDVGDCAEMLGTRAAPTIVPVRNPAAYTEALRQIAGDGSERQRLGMSNRARCVGNYSLDHMVDTYRTLYLEAARPAQGIQAG